MEFPCTSNAAAVDSENDDFVSVEGVDTKGRLSVVFRHGKETSSVFLSLEDSVAFAGEVAKIIHGTYAVLPPEPTPDQDRIEALEDDVKYLMEKLLVAQAGIVYLTAELTTLKTPKSSGLGSSQSDPRGSGIGSTTGTPSQRMIYAHCGFANG